MRSTIGPEFRNQPASMPRKGAKPPQHQRQRPGREHRMVPRPRVTLPDCRGSGKLAGKVALITGGDSGIGRAVHFSLRAKAPTW
jgi:hypothetical protein